MNISDKAKQIIAAVAPVLGTAIGGPFGGLAGALVSKALGVPAGDAKAMETAVTSGDSDVLLKLKQADNDFQEQMKALDISADKLVYDDRANARAREMAVRDTTPRNLAYAYTLGFFLTMGMQFIIVLSAVKLDPTALRLLDTTTGVLFAMMLGCKEYYFGSSAGSKAKDETIASIAGK